MCKIPTDYHCYTIKLIIKNLFIIKNNSFTPQIRSHLQVNTIKLKGTYKATYMTNQPTQETILCSYIQTCIGCTLYDQN